MIVAGTPTAHGPVEPFEVTLPLFTKVSIASAIASAFCAGVAVLSKLLKIVVKSDISCALFSAMLV